MTAETAANACLGTVFHRIALAMTIRAKRTNARDKLWFRAIRSWQYGHAPALSRARDLVPTNTATGRWQYGHINGQGFCDGIGTRFLMSNVEVTGDLRQEGAKRR